MITLHTNYGDIVIELDFENAPNTAANFKKYAEEGFYNGTVFHRVIDGFMIQGGGMTEDLSEKKEKYPPIQNEADNGLKNVTGSLAMARTSDPHSASSQFFINVKDNSFLNHTAKNSQGWGYAVFGKVTAGMDVVNKIKGVKTGSKGHHQDVPLEAVIIQSVTLDDSAK
ncbi:MAG: peptidylprolyl isomerase [Cellvibrio sp.]